MEEARQILDYLPRSFKTEKEQEYINFGSSLFQVGNLKLNLPPMR